MIDYKYFVDLGLVTEARKIEDKITNLRRFFQISSLDILLTPDFLVNYRTATQSFNDKTSLILELGYKLQLILAEICRSQILMPKSSSLISQK
mgnify:CR=1 FL=1